MPLGLSLATRNGRLTLAATDVRPFDCVVVAYFDIMARILIDACVFFSFVAMLMQLDCMLACHPPPRSTACVSWGFDRICRLVQRCHTVLHSCKCFHTLVRPVVSTLPPGFMLNSNSFRSVVGCWPFGLVLRRLLRYLRIS